MPSYGITHESGAPKRVLVHHPGELELANSDPAEHHSKQPVDVDRFIADHGSLKAHFVIGRGMSTCGVSWKTPFPSLTVPTEEPRTKRGMHPDSA